MNDELRKLDEAADESLSCGPFYTAIAAGMNAATAEYYAAASPDVVLRLMDRIAELEEANRACVDAVAEWGAKAGALQAEVDRLRDLFKAENDVHRQHTRGLNQRLDMERDTILDIAAGFKSERDEAREAVRRLAGALEDYANMVPYRITGEALTPTQLRELIEQIARQCEATLADPVVRRIVEGG